MQRNRDGKPPRKRKSKARLKRRNGGEMTTTPKKSVRRKCVECVGSPFQVETCGGDQMIGQGDVNNICHFFPYRNGDGRPSVKTIRKFCLDCMGQTSRLVTECASSSCPVHLFRFGTNPNRSRQSDGDGLDQAVEPCFTVEIRQIAC